MVTLQGQTPNCEVRTAPVLAVGRVSLTWLRWIIQAGVNQREYPLVAPVTKRGEKSPQRDIGPFAELVIGAASRSPAGAIVDIVAEVHAVIVWSRAASGRHGLKIVDAATVVVVRAADQHSPLLVRAKAASDCAATLLHGTPTNNRSVPDNTIESNSRRLAGSLGHQIDGTTDSIGVNVGLQRLVNLYRVHQIGSDSVQLDLANTRLRRRNRHSIHHSVAETRFGSANLHILAFALVTLNR